MIFLIHINVIFDVSQSSGGGAPPDLSSLQMVMKSASSEQKSSSSREKAQRLSPLDGDEDDMAKSELSDSMSNEKLVEEAIIQVLSDNNDSVDLPNDVQPDDVSDFCASLTGISKSSSILITSVDKEVKTKKKNNIKLLSLFLIIC